MQEAEACDLCWLKSDLSQAEKHIAELEIRAENAERKRDEAKARAATAEAARLDADLQVARDQKRIAELKAHLRKIHDRARARRGAEARRGVGGCESCGKTSTGIAGGEHGREDAAGCSCGAFVPAREGRCVDDRQ